MTEETSAAAAATVEAQKMKEEEEVMEESTPEENSEEDITGDGGVMKKILKEGDGWKMPEKGWEVSVHYDGTLLDGTKFDSSRDRGEPFKFKVGENRVIKGWEEGIKTMKKNEKAILTIKPEYGYGAEGAPRIPGNSVLKFEVELLDWQEEKDVSEKKDGGILKKVLKEGEGWETPSEDTKVKVTYTARIKDQEEIKDLKTDFEFVCGEEQVILGLDQGVQSMKKGEKALLYIKPEYTSGSDWIPSGSDVVYDVELVDFVKEKSSWQMSTEEKFEAATKKKEEGNSLFAKQKLEAAMRKYKKANDFFQYDSSLTEEEKEKAKTIKLPCFLNTAVCQMKLKQYTAAIESCTKGLEIDPDNIKALLRRGTSHSEVDQWNEASEDLNRLLELDPQNKDARRELAKLKKKIAEQDKKDRSLFGGMFEKLAAQDEARKRKREEEEKKRKEEEKEVEKKILEDTSEKMEAAPTVVESAAS